MEVEREVEENYAKNKSRLSKTCRACFASPVHEDMTLERLQNCIGLRLFPEDSASLSFCRRCSRDIRSADNFRRRCLRSNELLKKGASADGAPKREIKLEEDELKIEYDVPPPHFTDDDATPPNGKDRMEEPTTKDEGAIEYGEGGVAFTKSGRGADRRFSCSQCGYASNNRRTMSVHVSTHTGERPYECDVCHKSYSHPKSLASHRRFHANDAAEIKCEHCDEIFATNRALYCHMKVHRKRRRFQCELCGKSFPRRVVLELHVKTHSDERPFKCDACPKAFVEESLLAKHARIHTGERPYRCDACPKAFAYKFSLKVHRAVHVGGPTHECRLCPKVFAQRGGLTDHMKSHTGERPHKCDVCGRAFARRTYLTLHTRTHTGEKPYQCEVCTKAFSQNSALSTHMKIHAKEKAS